MSANNFEILWPKNIANVTEITAIYPPQSVPAVSEHESSGLDLGWGGAVGFLVLGALALKIIHGPEPK